MPWHKPPLTKSQPDEEASTSIVPVTGALSHYLPNSSAPLPIRDIPATASTPGKATIEAISLPQAFLPTVDYSKPSMELPSIGATEETAYFNRTQIWGSLPEMLSL